MTTATTAPSSPPVAGRRAPQDSPPITVGEALGRIAARAAALDAAPRFPAEDFEDLRRAGVLQAAANRSEMSLTTEIALVRAVAAADASTARILDGHLNGVERLALSAPTAVREADLRAIAAGALTLGVWGADPAPGEGEPARLRRERDGRLVLDGVKTFCSGAGGVQRALVVVWDHEGETAHDGDRDGVRAGEGGAQGADGVRAGGGGVRRLAYVDTSTGIEIDREWYRASGLRSSESHRVVFGGATVLALLGEANELSREPWFSRDAVRTAATWAGIADSLREEALRLIAGRRRGSELDARAVARMTVASSTVDRWLAHATSSLEVAEATGEDRRRDRQGAIAVARAGEDRERVDPPRLAMECRAAISDSCETVVAEAVRACGSRSLIGGGPLDRGRRDLDLFLLQHRPDPQLVRLGESILAGPGPTP